MSAVYAATLLLLAKRDTVLPAGTVIRIGAKTRGVLALSTGRARATIGITLPIGQRKSRQIDRWRWRLRIARNGRRRGRRRWRRDGWRTTDRRCRTSGEKRRRHHRRNEFACRNAC